MFRWVLFWTYWMSVTGKLHRIQPNASVTMQPIQDWFDQSAFENDDIEHQNLYQSGWNRIVVRNAAGQNLLTADDFVACYTTLENVTQPTMDINGKHSMTFAWGMRTHPVQPLVKGNDIIVSIKCKNLGPKYKNDLRYRWYSATTRQSYYLMFNTSRSLTDKNNNTYNIVKGSTVVPGGKIGNIAFASSDDTPEAMLVAPCSNCPSCTFNANTQQCESTKGISCESAEHAGMTCPIRSYSTEAIDTSIATFKPQEKASALSSTDLTKKICDTLTSSMQVTNCKSRVSVNKMHTSVASVTVSNESSVVDWLSTWYDAACNTHNIEECCLTFMPPPCSANSLCCLALQS